MKHEHREDTVGNKGSGYGNTKTVGKQGSIDAVKGGNAKHIIKGDAMTPKSHGTVSHGPTQQHREDSVGKK